MCDVGGKPSRITSTCLVIQQMCGKVQTLPGLLGRLHALKFWGKRWVLRGSVMGKENPFGTVSIFFLV